MEDRIRKLSNVHLKEIARELKEKIHKGLAKDGEEIACSPTYINPGKDFEGKVLTLDWGGTNFRASVLLFEKGKSPEVLETLKKNLSAEEIKGFTCADLCKVMVDLIIRLEHLDSSIKTIGYCFSYPIKSTLGKDAILERWTKGINIPDMIGKLVGKPLMDCLNERREIKEKNIRFQNITVINDTIACLFSGLEWLGFDSYIGLIVGTGTNMAGVIRKEQVIKLNEDYKKDEKGVLIPVNLESGNLIPYTSGLTGEIYLTEIDKKLDLSLPEEERRGQLLEKAISGKYIGKLYKKSLEKDNYDFDGEDLTDLMNQTKKKEDIARQIYIRSAQLVAASLVGLTLVLTSPL